ncbi:MAG: 3-isopropylmalate dehydratase small subunit [bacterium]|nr:isopropylmalate isomerase [Deltaproteobacteria bacterium]MCP4907548.1 3-isopropylmalate dehydratase small subunit [bacterium]
MASNEDVLIKIESVEGTGCVVRGDDVDTDRIIPARFMKVVTFDDMGRHAFEDARKAAKGKHPLDDERFSDASILICGQNFGCGSSREHAPQALMRFGFKAFIGGSFAEIFAGNCTSLGLPCVTLGEADLTKLMDAVELDPTHTISIDLRARRVSSRAGEMEAGAPEGVRQQFLEGSWDATRVLLDAGDAIEKTAAALPYIELPA